MPVVASNTALAEFLDGLPLELRFRARDPQDLARALAGLAAGGAEARAQAGSALRVRVEEGHSVGAWADAVLANARELGPTSAVHSSAP